MIQEVIDLLSSRYQNCEHDNWENPQGKNIPCIRFSSHVLPENNDGSCYFRQVTVWNKTVSIEIVEYFGDCDPETNSEDRWVDYQIFRLFKVSHREFLDRYDELLQKADKILYEKFIP